MQVVAWLFPAFLLHYNLLLPKKNEIKKKKKKMIWMIALNNSYLEPGKRGRRVNSSAMIAPIAHISGDINE